MENAVYLPTIPGKQDRLELSRFVNIVHRKKCREKGKKDRA